MFSNKYFDMIVIDNIIKQVAVLMIGCYVNGVCIKNTHTFQRHTCDISYANEDGRAHT